MKTLKGFLIGFLSCLIITFSIPTFAEGILQTIDVAVNAVTIMVDGEEVTADNFIYDGRTYVQVKGFADVVGSGLEWDEETYTISLTTQAPPVTTTTTPDKDIEDSQTGGTTGGTGDNTTGGTEGTTGDTGDTTGGDTGGDTEGTIDDSPSEPEPTDSADSGTPPPPPPDTQPPGYTPPDVPSNGRQ